jgi:hypothetical protein
MHISDDRTYVYVYVFEASDLWTKNLHWRTKWPRRNSSICSLFGCCTPIGDATIACEYPHSLLIYLVLFGEEWTCNKITFWPDSTWWLLKQLMVHKWADAGMARQQGRKSPRVYMGGLHHLKTVYTRGFRCYRGQILLLCGILKKGTSVERVTVQPMVTRQ